MEMTSSSRRAAWSVAWVVGTVVWLAASVASAQGGGGVIDLEETVIEGRIQKPEAFYILQHANLQYKALEPKRSFIDELIKSAQKEPF